MVVHRSASYAVLGDAGIAAGLGKKGTQTDLALYDRKEPGITRTWVVPVGYPDKVPPLFEAINMTESAILHVDELDRFAGERIVALDILGQKRGVLSHAYGVDADTLASMTRGTVVEGYRAAPGPGEIGGMLGDLEAEAEAAGGPGGDGGPARVVVDHCFDVRGAGTVVLGTVATGTVAQYDRMRIYPSGAEVTVKSIQMHDDPVAEAPRRARVGLSLKGARPEDVARGDMLVACGGDAAAAAGGEDPPVCVTDDLGVDFVRTPYYKGDVASGQMCMVNVGLKTVAGRFSSVDPVRIKLDRPVAHGPGDVCVVLKPESAGIRILGGGGICSA